jgi:hypothetical protein
MGQVKTIRVGTEAWKVHFDGYGKGAFEGERMPTKIMDLQQYYHLLQKRKNESDE